MEQLLLLQTARCKLGMLTGLDFPGSRKNFPFPGKKIPEWENFGKLVQSIATKFRGNTS